MSESATEPKSEREWLDGLGADGDFSDLDEYRDDDDPELVDEDAAATGEEGSPPSDPEGAAPEPEEGDAAAHEEGPADGDAESPAEDAAEPEAGEPEAAAEAKVDEAEKPVPGVDPKAPEEPELKWEPFSARADKTDIKLDGALASEQGIWIPRETWRTQLQPHLAVRSVWERERQLLEQRAKDAESHKSQREVEAEELVKFYNDLLAKPRDEQWAWFEDLQNNAPALLARIEAAGHKHRADKLQAERDRENEAAQLEETAKWMSDTLQSAVEAATRLEEHKDLGLKAEALSDRLIDLHDRGVKVFFIADQEFVTQNPGWGLKVGDRTIDWRLVDRVAKEEARIARAERAAAAAVQAGKKANDTKQRGKRRTPPPAVPAGGTPVPAGQDPGSAESIEAWRARMGLDH